MHLSENMINEIEDDTFSGLKYLEVLALSGNAIKEIPAEIFNLPMLRNLYMAEMNIGDAGFQGLNDIEKPIKAPLAVLSIADTRINKMPDFGILPSLTKLNISHNKMLDLTPQQFSPFCRLKEIDLYGTRMGKCQCEEVSRFLYKNRDIYMMTSFYCDANGKGEIF